MCSQPDIKQLIHLSTVYAAGGMEENKTFDQEQWCFQKLQEVNFQYVEYIEIM